jgi:pyruvate dehydrogenase E2 component (dihydrolipoamide acetyltransferase)
VATDTVVEVVMPQMGVSVSEGTVTRWLRNVGDAIQADETLLEISTDKVDTEVPSPGSGVLLEILVKEGETVPVGTIVGRIGPGAGAVPASPGMPPPLPLEPEPELPRPVTPDPEPLAAAPEPVACEPEPVAPEPEPVGEPEPVAEPEPGPPAPAPTGNGAGGGHHSFVSPVVARIAAEHGIDPRMVSGTGRDGRVTKRDILAFVEVSSLPAPDPAETGPQDDSPTATASPTPPPAPAAVPPAPPPPLSAAPPAPPVPLPAAAAAPPAAPQSTVSGQRQPLAEPPVEAGESLEPMSAMRRGIAEHMRRSLDTSAHVTSAIEVDMSKVVTIRERLKADFRSAYGVSLTYLAFVSRATVETLSDWPYINAEIRGESVLTRGYVNLGFAVALDSGKGLIVPVLKHAEGLNLLGMARGIADLAERARTKKLLPDDVQGGTFTITNPGSYGTFIGTPVISQPQTGILGTYAVVKRPWVISDDAGRDAIAIRPMMNLTLTYDHRLVDGAYAGQFLRDLTDRLQSWGESDY